MNKMTFIIFPLIITSIAFVIFISLGATERNHFEMPILLSVFILLFIKVRKYNDKIKKEHRLSLKKDISTDEINEQYKEKIVYKNSQKVLNLLILQMFIIYILVAIILSIVL